MATPIFVYGTLRRGEPNAWRLEASWFAGAATLDSDGFAFADLGAFPALVRTGSDAERVRGEVYEVGPRTLAALDRLEGVPHLYERVQVRVLFDDGREQVVQTYAMRAAQVREYRATRISGGDWLKYRNAFQEAP